MRRFLLLLIGLVALSAFAPSVPAAAAAPHAPTHARMPAVPCHDGQPADAATHACLGCALQPEAAIAAAPVATLAAQPVAARVSARADHRTGFDPPPPRAAG